MKKTASAFKGFISNSNNSRFCQATLRVCFKAAMQQVLILNDPNLQDTHVAMWRLGTHLH